MLRSLLAVSAVVLWTTSAHAAIFKPDSATASSEFSSGYDALQTIDGSGLTGGGLDPLEAHGAYVSGGQNHWTTASGDVLGASITWTFDADMALSGIYIWNHQSSAGHANNTGYDVTLFDLILRDAADAVLLSLTNLNLAPDTATAQLFGGQALTLGIRSVEFIVRGTQNAGTPYTGLAEVAFTDDIVSTVPLPAALPLFLAGLGSLVVLRRRR